ncbi:hypothetical protein EK419_09715 [Campylobacter coli]|nr:hypothetical protein EK419_09715 [Campylobacter coli]
MYFKKYEEINYKIKNYIYDYKFENDIKFLYYDQKSINNIKNKHNNTNIYKTNKTNQFKLNHN